MKFGIRKPSWRKSLAARTSIKRRLMPRMPRGYGFLRSPKKAMYNKVYNKTSVSATKIISDVFSNKPRRSKKASGGCMVSLLIIAILLLITSGLFAQVKFLPAKNYTQLKAAEDSLVAVLPQYNFVRTDSSVAYGNNGDKEMNYTDIFEDAAHLTICFYYDKKDNVFCNRVLGSFDDLFVYWKKYFQYNADHDRVSMVGGNASRSTFKKAPAGSNWLIYIY